LTLSPVPDKNPKTKIKVSGKTRVKTTALGLRVIDLKLALAIASMAFV